MVTVRRGYARRVNVDGPIDEGYVRRVVDELRRLGFPSSEGYYLVLLSELEGRELVFRLRQRTLVPVKLYAHPPEMLAQTMRFIGATYVCTLGDAVVGLSRC